MSKWILDTGSTYHIYLKRKLFVSFEKLNGGVMSCGDGPTCCIEGICTVCVKLFDGIIRELKDVKYISSMKKNLVSVGVLKVKGMKGTLGEGILKMSSGSLVVLKSIRCKNMYYLIGSAVIGNLEASKHLEGDSTRLWHKWLGEVGLKSDQALIVASTRNLESRELCVLDKKKVRFSTIAQHLQGLLELVHVDVWGPTKTASLGGHKYFIFIIADYSRHCWVYSMRQRVEILELLEK